MTIRELIDQWAVTRGEEVFLIAPDDGAEVTYRELRERVRELERRFEALGIGAGDKVAFLMDNGLWTAVLFLGAMYAGRVVVPLNAVSGNGQLAYVVDHSDSRALFVSPTYRDRVDAILADVHRPLDVIETPETSGPQWPEDATGGGAAPGPVAGDDEALLIYTSGTTGRPKGVLHTHRSVIAGARNTVEAHALSENDRGLCVLPLYHINAEIVSAVAPLLSGGSVVVPRRFSAGRFWQHVERCRCTWFSVVPTIIAYLLDKADESGRRVREDPAFAQVRFGRSASSALPPASHRAFEEAFGIPVIETMGLSETAAQILSNPLPPAQTQYGSPGIAYGNEVTVISESGRELPPGESGELMVRGDNVMKAYYKNAEATAETLEPDGWLHTGDLGYRDAAGFFFITGRLKELIIKGGENIAPREIDDALFHHPGVLEAAAFGVPDENYGQEVMACVVLKDDARCDADEIRSFCVERLGRYKAPRGVLVVQRLPKGASGKVQRLKIADVLDELLAPADDGSTAKGA